jgi:hypothetical protein
MKTLYKLRLSAVALTLAVGSGHSNAAVLASYIDGTDIDAAALVNQATPSGYTASDLTLNSLGSGTTITVTTVGTQATPSGSEWLNLDRSFMATTPTPTNSGTDFIEFNISGTGGNTLDLTSLTFDSAVAVSNSATGFQFFYQLYASTDGVNYSTVGGAGSSPAIGNNTTGDYLSATVMQSIDLTGLANSSTYYFQLYLGDNASTGSKAGLIQNFNLNGEIVAIPEPSITVLVGAYGALLLVRRRRC